MRRRLPGLVLALLPLLAAAGGCGSARAAEEKAPEHKALDPVVRDVVRMLQAGVAAETVTAWLDHSGARPGQLAPDDLIALVEAKAPEALTRRLVELSGAPVSAPKPSPLPSPAGPAPPAAAEATQPAVTFEIRYRSQGSDEDEPPWDLYLYLDGRPLTWLPGGGSLRPRESTFVRRITPGRHRLAILQERHRSWGNDRWTHEARVCPVPVEADLEDGGSWEVRIEVNASPLGFRRKRGPVRWTVLRDGEVTAGEESAGPDVDRWPALCEELETEIRPGHKVPKYLARELNRCTRWGDLWTGLGPVPDRKVVREVLARNGYRPVPVSSR